MRRLFTGEVQKYGEAKKQNEIAKKMKDEGAEVEFIVRVTGLTKEEVEAL